MVAWLARVAASGDVLTVKPRSARWRSPGLRSAAHPPAGDGCHPSV